MIIGRLLALAFASFVLMAIIGPGFCGDADQASWAWLVGYIALLASGGLSMQILGEWLIDGITRIARRAA